MLRQAAWLSGLSLRGFIKPSPQTPPPMGEGLFCRVRSPPPIFRNRGHGGPRSTLRALVFMPFDGFLSSAEDLTVESVCAARMRLSKKSPRKRAFSGGWGVMTAWRGRTPRSAARLRRFPDPAGCCIVESLIKSNESKEPKQQGIHISQPPLFPQPLDPCPCSLSD